MKLINLLLEEESKEIGITYNIGTSRFKSAEINDMKLNLDEFNNWLRKQGINDKLPQELSRYAQDDTVDLIVDKLKAAGHQADFFEFDPE